MENKTLSLGMFSKVFKRNIDFFSRAKFVGFFSPSFLETKLNKPISREFPITSESIKIDQFFDVICTNGKGSEREFEYFHVEKQTEKREKCVLAKNGSNLAVQSVHKGGAC